jgi:hypothetical protein
MSEMNFSYIISLLFIKHKSWNILIISAPLSWSNNKYFNIHHSNGS